MKWGSKKSSSSPSSSSSTSVITRVFPVSWFSNKFKHNSGKMKQRGQMDSATQNSSLTPRWKEGRFYSMDDGYWRLSFGEERVGGRRSVGGINPLWYDSDQLQAPVSRLNSYYGLKEMEVPRNKASPNFNEKLLTKMDGKEEILLENGHKKVTRDGEFQSLMRRKVGNDRRLSLAGAKEKRGVKPDEKESDIFVVEPNDKARMKLDNWNSAASKARKQRHSSFLNSGPSSVSKDYAFEGLHGEETYSEFRNLKEKEIKEVAVITEDLRKSAYIGKESRTRKLKQNNRVRAYSPRTECKIRLLEDMKRTRMKSTKKALKEQIADRRNVYDSFAVVKSSFNPQRDFKDSMAEMIREKEIRGAKELEELLACYLTLNSDEYHSLIIKVFKQVWFELHGMR